MPRPGAPKPGLNPTIPPEKYGRKPTSSTGRAERTMSASALATFLDVDRGTVKRWIDAGMPRVSEPEGKGGSYMLDVADVVKWLMGKAAADAKPAPAGPGPEDGLSLPPGYETKEEADRRRAVALANIAEIEEEEAAKRVVPIEAVADLMAAERINARTKLENLGATLAGRTAKITDAAQIKELADRLVREAVDCLVGDVSPLMADGPGEADDAPEADA